MNDYVFCNSTIHCLIYLFVMMIMHLILDCIFLTLLFKHVIGHPTVKPMCVVSIIANFIQYVIQGRFSCQSAWWTAKFKSESWVYNMRRTECTMSYRSQSYVRPLDISVEVDMLTSEYSINPSVDPSRQSQIFRQRSPESLSFWRFIF